MQKPFTNINECDWEEGESSTGGIWRSIDLSGEHLGVRIEETAPGCSSSVHHFHTREEEHVLVLEGHATLVLGSERLPLSAGDHVWFAAGKEEPHHIENKTTEPFKFLVFGERNSSDVVVYPEHQVMMVKALGRKLFTYRPVKQPDESEGD